jgi:hypothetical protein
MADLANYGTVLHGSRSVAVFPAGTTNFAGTATFTAIAENISIDKPTSEITRRAADGTENGWVTVKQPTSGSATLQFLTTQNCELRGCLFQSTLGGPQDVYVITNAGYSESIGDEIKVSVRFKSTTFV